MKNASSAQITALRRRAARIADRLPPLRRDKTSHLTPESRAALDRQVARIARAHRAVGLSLVLCAPNGADDFFHYGFARLQPNIPVTENTYMRLASVSKLVMTFGALSLCEDGLLHLDADIGDLLGYPVRNPHAPDVPVTLRMLLTHTASLRDEGTYGTRGMQSGCTLRELLEDPRNWLGQKPGDSFHYSNLGAGVAGCLMELAAGMPLDDVMQQRVFTPLSIRASYDPRRIVPADDLADGYSVRPFLPPKRRYNAAFLAARPPEIFDPERDYLCAAGRMITDSRGIAGLCRLLASRDGMGVLSASSLETMRAVQDGVGGIQSAGRGLNVAFLPDVFPGASPVGHQGVAYGMCAELFADPQNSAGVGLMTSGVRLDKRPPLTRAGFDLLALGFAAIDQSR